MDEAHIPELNAASELLVRGGEGRERMMRIGWAAVQPTTSCPSKDDEDRVS
jgi:hypothetical protein